MTLSSRAAHMRVLVIAGAVLGFILGVGLIVVSMLDERAYPFSGPKGETPPELRAERALARMRFRDVEPRAECGDCARQEAGFAYARSRRVRNPDYCPSQDEDFQDGCRAYGEQVEAADVAAGY